MPHSSHANSSSAFYSAELASTLPFSVVLGPLSLERHIQTEVSGALLRNAWSTGKSSSRSRSRGPSLHLDLGIPKSPPVHALRAKGESILWNPRPRPVPSSRGHYASYPSTSSLLTVHKATTPADIGLQLVPKKAHSSTGASVHAGHSSALPGSVGCNLGHGQQSAPFPKQVVREGSTGFLSSASIHSMQWKKLYCFGKI